MLYLNQVKSDQNELGRLKQFQHLMDGLYLCIDKVYNITYIDQDIGNNSIMSKQLFISDRKINH